MPLMGPSPLMSCRCTRSSLEGTASGYLLYLGERIPPCAVNPALIIWFACVVGLATQHEVLHPEIHQRKVHQPVCRAETVVQV